MKYIINENQLELLLENDPMLWVKRRVRKEILKEYIREAEVNFPMLCDEFLNGEDYSNTVIKWATDDFLTTHEEMFLDDLYDEVSDTLVELCRNWFSEELISIYDETCKP